MVTDSRPKDAQSFFRSPDDPREVCGLAASADFVMRGSSRAMAKAAAAFTTPNSASEWMPRV